MSNLSPKYATILAFLNKLKEHGSWCGETHIQKTLFFFSRLTKSGWRFDYILYKYGPYSFDLRDALGDLFTDGLIKYEPQEPPYRPKIVVPPSYEQNAESVTDIKLIEYITETLGECNVSELERYGTALFLLSNGEVEKRAINSNERKENIRRLRKIKPHIKEEEAVEAFDKVEEILKGYSNN